MFSKLDIWGIIIIYDLLIYNLL